MCFLVNPDALSNTGLGLHLPFTVHLTGTGVISWIVTSGKTGGQLEGLSSPLVPSNLERESIRQSRHGLLAAADIILELFQARFSLL